MKIIMVEIDDEDYEKVSDSLFLLIKLLKEEMSKERDDSDSS
tara:strand:+ start:15986 stop:16111 length:126 start_codon:yes stop_codon:yes gene_type:complete